MMKKDSPKVVQIEDDLSFIKDNPIIKKFINFHRLDEAFIKRYTNMLYAVADDSTSCSTCKSLSHCPKQIVGSQMRLLYDNNYLSVDYAPCHYYEQYQINQKIRKNLIKIGDVTNDTNKKDLIINKKRSVFLGFYQSFINSIKKGNTAKGCFLYGTYGSGKSYIMYELAKELASLDQQVVLTYYPDLVNLMKSLIGQPLEQEKLLKTLKETNILIIDDFGGVMLTEYVRDELVLPVLQSRMVHQRPTFMTANLNKEGLAEYLVNSKNAPDKALGYRIFERISSLMTYIEYDDYNYRLNKQNVE